MFLFVYAAIFLHCCAATSHTIFVLPTSKSYGEKISAVAFDASCCTGNAQDLLMTSNTFNQKSFIPTPPEKGSFPLDHESVCKKYYLRYMNCLSRNNDNNSECRQAAKEYLGCRMSNNLMEQTSWSKLGFEDNKANATKNPLNPTEF